MLRERRFGDLSRSHAAAAIVSVTVKLVAMTLRGVVVSPRLALTARPLLVGRGVRIRNRSLISLAGRLVVEDFAEIHGLSSNGLRFGSRVSIGAFTMIRPSGYYTRAIGSGLSIGDDSSIGPQCYVGCSGQITIGSRVMLAPGVRLFAEDHVFTDPSISIKEQGVQFKPITIEDDCWIASGVTVLGGVTIGRGAVVAAGSVVTADVAPHTVVAGVPARLVKQIGNPQ